MAGGHQPRYLSRLKRLQALPVRSSAGSLYAIPCPDVPSLPHSQQAQQNDPLILYYILLYDTVSLAFLDPVLMSLKEGYKKSSKVVFKAPIREREREHEAGWIEKGQDLGGIKVGRM